MISFGSGKRHVLFVGGVHGNEKGTTVAEELARNLSGHPELVPPDMRVDVVLCANPDGLNRGTRANAHNVDLNRNFPSRNWHRRLWRGSTTGPRGGSEPETRALVHILRTGYEQVVSIHSRGGFIDYDGPGGRALAERMSRAGGIPIHHIGQEAFFTGSMGRYVPEAFRIPIITVEVNSQELSHAKQATLLAALR